MPALPAGQKTVCFGRYFERGDQVGDVCAVQFVVRGFVRGRVRVATIAGILFFAGVHVRELALVSGADDGLGGSVVHRQAGAAPNIKVATPTKVAIESAPDLITAGHMRNVIRRQGFSGATRRATSQTGSDAILTLQ